MLTVATLLREEDRREEMEMNMRGQRHTYQHEKQLSFFIHAAYRLSHNHGEEGEGEGKGQEEESINKILNYAVNNCSIIM